MKDRRRHDYISLVRCESSTCHHVMVPFCTILMACCANPTMPTWWPCWQCHNCITLHEEDTVEIISCTAVGGFAWDMKVAMWTFKRPESSIPCIGRFSLVLSSSPLPLQKFFISATGYKPLSMHSKRTISRKGLREFLFFADENDPESWVCQCRRKRWQTGTGYTNLEDKSARAANPSIVLHVNERVMFHLHVSVRKHSVPAPHHCVRSFYSLHRTLGV